MMDAFLVRQPTASDFKKVAMRRREGKLSSTLHCKYHTYRIYQQYNQCMKMLAPFLFRAILFR